MNLENIITKESFGKMESKSKGKEFRIVTEQARYPLKNLVEIFKSHILDPDYQRNLVWDTDKKSKLIESFIINIPVPPVFLYEVEFSKYEVMDGKQRISTIISFMQDEFKLQNLEYYSDCNGCKYSELDQEIKASIDRRYLSATILLKESTKDSEDESFMKRLVFERLNTGGLALNRQEIRNAIYPGKFQEMINRLSSNELYKQMTKDNTNNPESRMSDSELILRFFAYISAIKHQIAKPTAVILDTYMQTAMKFNDNEISFMEDTFLDTLERAKNIFGLDAFRGSPKSKKIERKIYDVVMLFTYKNKKFNKDFSKKKYDIMSKNKESFNGKYTSVKNVSDRVKLFENELVKNYGAD